MRFKCVQVPGYGKFYENSVYKGNPGFDHRHSEDVMIIRDQKNERKHFSLKPDSPYFFGRYFQPVEDNQ